MAEQQEEKKRKKYLLPVILLFAVCLIGAGFAYTAWTSNSGNQPISEYIELSQGGTGAYTFAPAAETHVYYDTRNTAAGVTNYKLTNAVYGSEITGKTVIHLGKQFTVHTVGKNIVSPTNLRCDFTTTNFEYNAVWNVYMKITGAAESPITLKLTADNTWCSGSGETWTTHVSYFNIVYGTGYNDVVFDFYYGYDGNVGTTTAPWSYPLDNPTTGSESPTTATIEFTVTNTGTNPIILDTTEVSVAVSNSVTVTPTLFAAGSISFDCSPEGKATATYSDGTITVSGVATGDTTIKVKLTVDTVIYSVDLKVHVTTS
jgi:hypothetical protein